MIRNFINVTGISDENELPTECPGQFVEYSETEYIFVPETTPPINTIYDVMLGIEVVNSRIINMHNNKVYILDGNKKFKIVCSSKDKYNKSMSLKFNYPFNAFIDIENDVHVKSAKVFVLDAYFHLINSRTIYCNITYLISVEYNSDEKNINSSSRIEPQTNNYDMTLMRDPMPSYTNTQKLFIEDDTNETFDIFKDVKDNHTNMISNNTYDSTVLNTGLAEQSLTKEDNLSDIQYIDLFEEYL